MNSAAAARAQERCRPATPAPLSNEENPGVRTYYSDARRTRPRRGTHEHGAAHGRTPLPGPGHRSDPARPRPAAGPSARCTTVPALLPTFAAEADDDEAKHHVVRDHPRPCPAP